MQRATILLVEDDPDNRVIYRTYLEHVGYEVVEAHDGEEALRRARTNEPDLILLDMSIPKIDGWEVCRILKADEGTSHIPVIALTAHALASDQAKATDAGCDAYVSKPAEPRDVVREIQRQLDSHLRGARHRGRSMP